MDVYSSKGAAFRSQWSSHFLKAKEEAHVQFLRPAGVAVREGLPAVYAPLLCLSGRLKEGVHSDHVGLTVLPELPLDKFSRCSQGQSYRDVK